MVIGTFWKKHELNRTLCKKAHKRNFAARETNRPAARRRGDVRKRAD